MDPLMSSADQAGVRVTAVRRMCDVGLRAIVAAAALVMCAAQAPPQENAAGNPPGADQQSLALSQDAASRLTIPVTIDGKGPFLFVIDTGSDRTVISRELATELSLPKGPVVALRDTTGVTDVGTVVIDRLGVGTRQVDGIDAPVLAAANLGAAGMLGIDSLREQHVVMDFKNNALSSSPSRPEWSDPHTIVVMGRSKFGQLILVDASVRGRRVYVILDFGAEKTIGNLALQRLLTRGQGSGNEATTVEELSVTGRRFAAERESIRELRLAGLTIRNMPLAFADVDTFEHFGLGDKPAMLLGMDVLRLCERVTVDFGRREASFTVE